MKVRLFMKNGESRFSERKSPIVSETVSDQVYQYLKDAIIRGELRTGERIVQEDLTRHLHVSRTPVRDALQRLSAEGLVTIKPFHGAVVFELSQNELHELYDIRILMENYAAQKSLDSITTEQIEQLATLNENILSNSDNVQECMVFDREFHTISCCSNTLHYIKPFLDSVWDKSNPYKALYYTKPQFITETYHQHNMIIDSFRRKDPAMLAKAIDHHLRDVVSAVSMSPLLNYAK